VDNVHVDSNGTDFTGRAAYVELLKRFLVPFPDLRIDDSTTVVDGNIAAIRLMVTGNFGYPP
jgi:SnoaL-like domain